MRKAHCLWAWWVVVGKTLGHIYGDSVGPLPFGLGELWLAKFWNMYIEILWDHCLLGLVGCGGQNPGTKSKQCISFSSPAQQPRNEAVIHWM